MQEAMQEVLRCLRFTTKVGEGEDEWLATLNMMIRVEADNSISYIHYEKPTTTYTVVQRRSALDENSKVQILSNDLMRRLGNSDDRQGGAVKRRVVDQFSQKLLTSGYSITQSRRIILNGIRGWESKRRRAKGRLFKTAK